MEALRGVDPEVSPVAEPEDSCHLLYFQRPQGPWPMSYHIIPSSLYPNSLAWELEAQTQKSPITQASWPRRSSVSLYTVLQISSQEEAQ